MSYLVLRKSTYHFRMTIPADVRECIGRGEIHVSLREDDSRKARLKAGLYAFEVRRFIGVVRQAVKTLSDVGVKELVAEWRKRMVEKDAAIRRRIEVGLEPGGLERYSDNCVGVSDVLDHLMDAVAPAMPSQHGIERWCASQPEREAAFAKAGEIATGEASHDFVPLVGTEQFAELDSDSQRALLLSWLPAAASLFDQKADACHYVGTRLTVEPQAKNNVGLSVSTSGRASTALGQVWREYLAHMAATERAWREKPAGKASLAGQTFIGLIGQDKPIGSVNREDFDRYEWFINNRPPRSNGSDADEDLIALEASMRAADWTQSERLGERTVDEYLQRIVRFFDWAKDKGYVKEHCAAGMAYKLGDDVDDEDRDREPWSDDEIRRMLDPDNLKAFVDRRSQRALTPDRLTYFPWFLLFTCYTGARRSEIAGLMVDDIMVRDEQGEAVPLMLIRKNKVRPSLKNLSATRSIPLHAHVVDLGIAELATKRHEGGHERLLWGPVSGGDVGTKVSNDFTAYAKFLGVHDPTGKKVLHSFRHAFKTKARGHMEADVVDSIAGHAPRDSTGGTYVHYLSMPRREHRHSLNKLDFGLDLVGLKALLATYMPR